MKNKENPVNKDDTAPIFANAAPTKKTKELKDDAPMHDFTTAKKIKDLEEGFLQANGENERLALLGKEGDAKIPLIYTYMDDTAYMIEDTAKKTKQLQEGLLKEIQENERLALLVKGGNAQIQVISIIIENSF